jgi:hypothetical protein
MGTSTHAMRLSHKKLVANIEHSVGPYQFHTLLFGAINFLASVTGKGSPNDTIY